MKHFKKILICVHPEYTDLDIVDRTAAIAKGSGAAVKVRHTISDYPENMNEWWNVRNPKELHAKVVRERQDFIDSIVNRLKAIGIENITSELAWSKEGREFISIIRDIIKNGHELVVITSRHRSKIARRMFECPSRELFYHSPCAVWITQTHHTLTKQFHRVVAALGGEGMNVRCEGLNAKILETAASVAESEGSELHVVHALPIYGGQGLEDNKLRDDLMEHLERMRREIKETGNALIDNPTLKLTEERIHLVAGNPVSVIPEFIHERGIDLIVMGTITKRSIPAMFVGNTAEKIMDHLECGVLAVKPDGFVSLVTLEEEDQE